MHGLASSSRNGGPDGHRCHRLESSNQRPETSRQWRPRHWTGRGRSRARLAPPSWLPSKTLFKVSLLSVAEPAFSHCLGTKRGSRESHGLWGQKEHWAQFTGRDTGCCALPRAVGARVPRQLGSRPLDPIMPRGCGVALPQSQRQRQRRRCWRRSWGGHDPRSTKELAGNWEAPHFLLCKGPVRSAHHACGEGLFKAAALREQCVVETFWKVQAPERR